MKSIQWVKTHGYLQQSLTRCNFGLFDRWKYANGYTIICLITRMLHAELQSFLNEILELPDFMGITERPVGISTRSWYGDTPLHVAAVRGDTRMIALLLDAGAEIDPRGEHGYTPLNEAVGQGHIEAVKLLLSRGASANIPNDWGRTPRQNATKNPDLLILFSNVP